MLILKTVFLSAVCAIISYLLGSIDFAIIITRLFIKKDIRQFGSHNAGMTNVLRTVGVFPALLTLIGDFLKAIGAMHLSACIFSFLPFEQSSQIGMYIAGIFALMGHIYPLYFNFRGGKGVLTCAGIFFVLDFKLCLICVLVFLIVTFISGYVSLGSITGLACAPILTLIAGLTVRSARLGVADVLIQTAFILVLSLVAIIKHKDNIKRLMNGTENGFKKKK